MDIGPLVTRYARRFCRLHDGVHSVSSPLGAWLILALTAPLARGAVRGELEDILGTDAKHARRALDELLADPPDVIRTALAVWGVENWRDRGGRNGGCPAPPGGGALAPAAGARSPP